MGKERKLSTIDKAKFGAKGLILCAMMLYQSLFGQVTPGDNGGNNGLEDIDFPEGIPLYVGKNNAFNPNWFVVGGATAAGGALGYTAGRSESRKFRNWTKIAGGVVAAGTAGYALGGGKDETVFLSAGGALANGTVKYFIGKAVRNRKLTVNKNAPAVPNQTVNVERFIRVVPPQQNQEAQQTENQETNFGTIIEFGPRR